MSQPKGDLTLLKPEDTSGYLQTTDLVPTITPLFVPRQGGYIADFNSFDPSSVALDQGAYIIRWDTNTANRPAAMDNYGYGLLIRFSISSPLYYRLVLYGYTACVFTRHYIAGSGWQAWKNIDWNFNVDNSRHTTMINSGSADDITQSGYYRVTSAITELPYTGASFLIEHIQDSNSANYAWQLATDTSATTSIQLALHYRKKYTAGTWTPWYRLHSDGGFGIIINDLNAAPSTWAPDHEGHYRVVCNSSTTNRPAGMGTYSAGTLTKFETGGIYYVLDLIGRGGDDHFRRVYTGSAWGGWFKVWNENNDGATSNLDADKLDNNEGAYYAPKPNASATDSDAGRFRNLTAGDNAALTLPAGGTWAYHGRSWATAGGGTPTSFAGVAAGGTTIYAATSGRSSDALIWRVA
jgi:hypothetical protein